MVGKRDIMTTLLKPFPEGAVRGGTFAGNIMGLAAARATLALLSELFFYPTLLARAERFFSELQLMFDRSPLPARIQWVGCMFSVYIGTREPVQNYADIRQLEPDSAGSSSPAASRTGLLPQRLLRVGGAYAGCPG